MTRVHAAPLAALIAVCALGCTDQRPPNRSLDQSRARETLVAVLDAWKSGRSHTDPLESEPSLRVADDDWLAGRRLAEYRLLSGESVVGEKLCCPVALTLETPEGRRIQSQVVYLISTAPDLSVIRAE
ncbi:hypothetical protein [Tautonia rosea]|uniref:hypothetical protein n=1 Tax=Tautonia rosea TaxID=2728037 RepID=UPI001474E0FB|nr:hypothetical protein [Tautonia rosea]